jgi:hypothetical protein
VAGCPFLRTGRIGRTRRVFDLFAVRVCRSVREFPSDSYPIDESPESRLGAGTTQCRVYGIDDRVLADRPRRRDFEEVPRVAETYAVRRQNAAERLLDGCAYGFGSEEVMAIPCTYGYDDTAFTVVPRTHFGLARQFDLRCSACGHSLAFPTRC